MTPPVFTMKRIKLTVATASTPTVPTPSWTWTSLAGTRTGLLQTSPDSYNPTSPAINDFVNDVMILCENTP